MRHLPFLLMQVASSVAAVAGVAACSLQTTHSSCDGYVPNKKTVEPTADVACQIARDGRIGTGATSSTFVYGQSCDTACGPGFGGCTLPDEYIKAYLAGAVVSADAGVDAAVGSGESPLHVCPTSTATVKVNCSSFCEGRRTSGVADVDAPCEGTLGEYFAACSYLEAVSVHAFERLEGELRIYDAPQALIAAARAAHDDEVRHVALTRELALRFGAEPERPTCPSFVSRSLFEIARENAVEGCIRETYGATLALFRSMRAADAEVRAAMKTIAEDECRHAELAWEIAAWAEALLSVDERAAIHRAMREAVEELLAGGGDALTPVAGALCGMPSREERRELASMLDRRLFNVAA